MMLSDKHLSLAWGQVDKNEANHSTEADLSRREIDSDHTSETNRDLLSDEVEVPVLLLSAPL